MQAAGRAISCSNAFIVVSTVLAPPTYRRAPSSVRFASDGARGLRFDRFAWVESAPTSRKGADAGWAVDAGVADTGTIAASPGPIESPTQYASPTIVVLTTSIAITQLIGSNRFSGVLVIVVPFVSAVLAIPRPSSRFCEECPCAPIGQTGKSAGHAHSANG